MNRRQYIGCVGSVGLATALAGCGTLGGTTTLSNPSTDRSSGRGVALEFAGGGERVATLACRPATRRYPHSQGAQVPVDLSISHREDTTVRRVHLSLRTPTDGATPPAGVALRAPFGTADQPVSLYERESDGATIFTASNIGDQGAGTVVFEFIVTGLSDSATELAVGADVELGESGVLGNGYRLEGDVRVALPGPQ